MHRSSNTERRETNSKKLTKNQVNKAKTRKPRIMVKIIDKAYNA